MKFQKTIGMLVLCIVILSLAATAVGIFSNGGDGQYEFQSIRNQTVMIHGKGLYKHMSVELAPQGIAQDVVTMLLGIPLLIISFFLAKKGLLKGKLLLAGTLGYFFVTYLFYMNMGMYNELFLVYIVLTSTSFFAFSLTILSFETDSLHSSFKQTLPVTFVGGFLIFNTVAIALLWLQIIVTPLLDGSIYPPGLEHYTTLIVQGMDLSLLLPLAFLSGVLLIKRNRLGYLMAPVYTIFLALLMTALTGKIIGMTLIGVNVGPPLVIIPIFTLTAVASSTLILRSINEGAYSSTGISSGPTI